MYFSPWSTQYISLRHNFSWLLGHVTLFHENNALLTRDIKNIFPEANIFLSCFSTLLGATASTRSCFYLAIFSSCLRIAVHDSYKSGWMRKQAARIVLENIPRAIFPSFPLFPPPPSLFRHSVLIPTKGPLLHTVNSTGRGKWKTHRANTIHLRRPKHVAGWILPMKGGSRCGMRPERFAPNSPASFPTSPKLSTDRGWMIVWRFTDECRPSYNCNEP